MTKSEAVEMRKYESVFIFHPGLEEEKLNNKIKEVEKFISERKGKVENINKVGREKLPYPMRKSTEGLYVIFDFEFSPEDADDFKKRFLKDESVLRYNLIKK